MARKLKRLTARTVAALKKPGRHADGQNLYLKITTLSTTAISKSWTFLYIFAGKQREAGLGSVNDVALAQARDKAAEYRSLLAKGTSTRWPQRRPRAMPRRRAKPLANAPMSLSNRSHPNGAARSTRRNGGQQSIAIAGLSSARRLTQLTRRRFFRFCSRFGAGFQNPRHGYVAGSKQC